MASKSSMEQSFAKGTLANSDPYPLPFRKESLNVTYCQNTQSTQCSSVSQDTPSNCHSNPSTQKRLRSSSLDNEIKKLLQVKLARRVLKGRPSENLRLHRRRLIKELAEWIGGFETDAPIEDDNGIFRDQLVSLLATASKQYSKDIPLDNLEWSKLLTQWIKSNTSGAVLLNRDIYRILAVDGFRGFKAKHIKIYLSGVLLPLRKEYRSHVCGVRSMYEFFDKNEDVSALTGTDSACVVFLALIEWYSQLLKDDLMLDDQIQIRVGQVKSWAQGYLFQNAEYYRDIKNVDEDMLKEFGKVYGKQFQDSDSLNSVAREFLKDLNIENVG